MTIRRARIMLGVYGVSIAMILAWLLAFWSHVRAMSDVPATVNRLSIDAQPSTINSRFVASTLDRKKKVYHLPTCSYWKLTEHRREFASEADAAVAGYEPCSRCLVSTIRAAQSPRPQSSPR